MRKLVMDLKKPVDLYQRNYCNKGMSKEKAYVDCYREGLATDQLGPVSVYAGTRMGCLFHSADEGKSWRLIAQWLPHIYSVSTATIM